MTQTPGPLIEAREALASMIYALAHIEKTKGGDGITLAAEGLGREALTRLDEYINAVPEGLEDAVKNHQADYKEMDIEDAKILAVRSQAASHLQDGIKGK